MVQLVVVGIVVKVVDYCYFSVEMCCGDCLVGVFVVGNGGEGLFGEGFVVLWQVWCVYYQVYVQVVYYQYFCLYCCVFVLVFFQ